MNIYTKQWKYVTVTVLLLAFQCIFSSCAPKKTKIVQPEQADDLSSRHISAETTQETPKKLPFQHDPFAAFDIGEFDSVLLENHRYAPGSGRGSHSCAILRSDGRGWTLSRGPAPGNRNWAEFQLPGDRSKQLISALLKDKRLVKRPYHGMLPPQPNNYKRLTVRRKDILMVMYSSSEVPFPTQVTEMEELFSARKPIRTWKEELQLIKKEAPNQAMDTDKK